MFTIPIPAFTMSDLGVHVAPIQVFTFDRSGRSRSAGTRMRLLYFALAGTLEAGLVRTAEDALTVLRQASQPLGPMGAAWLAQQERRLDQA